MLGEKGVHLARSPVSVSMCHQDGCPIPWRCVPGGQFQTISRQQGDILVKHLQSGWRVIRRALCASWVDISQGAVAGKYDNTGRQRQDQNAQPKQD
jgi:hypothetical protein